MRPGFWHRVAIGEPDECWPWLAGRSKFGYGSVFHEGRVVGAHRVVYEWMRGPIPPGYCVCHTCDNPPCVNPAHLWLGTKADNLRDMWAKGRGYRPTKKTERQAS